MKLGTLAAHIFFKKIRYRAIADLSRDQHGGVFKKGLGLFTFTIKKSITVNEINYTLRSGCFLHRIYCVLITILTSQPFTVVMATTLLLKNVM